MDAMNEMQDYEMKISRESGPGRKKQGFVRLPMWMGVSRM